MNTIRIEHELLKNENIEVVKKSLEKMFIAYQMSQICEIDDASERANVAEVFLCLQNIINQID